MADVEGVYADTVPDWGGSGQCVAPSCGGRFDEGMTVKYFSDMKYPEAHSLNPSLNLICTGSGEDSAMIIVRSAEKRKPSESHAIVSL